MNRCINRSQSFSLQRTAVKTIHDINSQEKKTYNPPMLKKQPLLAQARNKLLTARSKYMDI